MDIKTAIAKVIARKDLTEKETVSVFDVIMNGKATPAQVAALLVALRMKGEAVQEITGAARAMRKKALRVNAGPGVVLDTCGTGGAGTDTFNISTASAFVVAGSGVKVAKHGNRSASSKCGSADVLEKLGVKIDVPRGVTEKCIKEIGIGFLFAPVFHGAMRHAAPVRREIGVRTIFNILGPLSNPAQATCQVVGVYDMELTGTIAKVLARLGSKRAYVVSGDGPLDEVSILGRTKVSELKKGSVRSYYVSPASFGVKKAAFAKIKGGTAESNAKAVKGVLSGKKGPRRDIVLMNASLGLMAAGIAKNFKDGIIIAARSIDSGKALEKLEKLVKMTRSAEPLNR